MVYFDNSLISDDTRGPKTKKANLVTMLKEKQDSERALRERELQLRRDELVLQRERFELEREERRASLDIQRKQNEMLMKLLDKH